jgi:hypothetical protein
LDRVVVGISELEPATPTAAETTTGSTIEHCHINRCALGIVRCGH